MEGVKDNGGTDSNINHENDLQIVKKYLIETVGKFKNNSTVELSNEKEALDLFDQKSKEGKDTVLYEVHRTPEDGRVVKKVPVLNSSKAAERMRILQEEMKRSTPQKAPMSSTNDPTTTTSDKKNKVTLASMKYKIIILVSVVVGFIATLLVVSMIADINSGGGSMAGHHFVAFEVFQMSVKAIDFEYGSYPIYHHPVQAPL